MATTIVRILVKLSCFEYVQKLLSVFLIAVLIVFLSFIGWSGNAQADHFQCYTGCSLALDDSNECKEGKNSGDYHKAVVSRPGEDVIVLAIHAGAIETETDRIANAISRENRWDAYTFTGHIKNNACRNLAPGSDKPNFDVLHITSENFNDPIAIEKVRSHQKAISIHGHGQPHASGSICVGGLNEAQRNEFITDINRHKSAFKLYPLNPIDTPRQTSGDCSENFLKGISRRNIVNQNLQQKGLQLELNLRMRKDLVKSGEDYDQLRQIIYGGITQAMTQ